ncbi:MAG: sulfotransferase domain-containing protein [Bacteroidales bacterium]|nr:sulfotransferase domain-containing protein [Bacteroidales bacterium]MCF8337839.1 sulfotransferase domain-containing protein [Bacteroidales bacterium]
MDTHKPNFFIIGAAKAGTTSLYEYLKQHPDIYFSPVKEPNYFSTDIQVAHFSNTYKKNTFLDTETYFSKKNLEPLQLAFVRKPEHYRRLFEDVSGEKAVGEASTSYLYSSVAAENIKMYNPRAKVVAILRNPMERAVSHYQMALRYGHTRLGFRQAIETDMNKNPKGWGISELYIELGLYYQQLKRYFDLFPAENIKVLLLDDFKEDPQRTVKDCQRFLGVKEITPNAYEIYNKARIPRFKLFNKFITESGIKKLLKKQLPGRVQEKLKDRLFSEGEELDVTKEDIVFLKTIYREDIEKTSRLINRDLSAWLKI